MKFVNLYTETEYSLLASPNKITELLEKASLYHYQSLAITDYNNMYGAVKFYCECKSKNIKPIIGLHFDVGGINLLLYAKNLLGYKELLRLATIAKIESNNFELANFMGKVDNCIAVIPSDENEIVKKFLSGNIAESSNMLLKYKSVLSELYFGIDLQTVLMKEKINELIGFAANYKVPCVALQKVSYLNKENFDAYIFLKCIGLALNNYPYTEKEMNLNLLPRLEVEGLFS